MATTILENNSCEVHIAKFGQLQVTAFCAPPLDEVFNRLQNPTSNVTVRSVASCGTKTALERICQRRRMGPRLVATGLLLASRAADGPAIIVHTCVHRPSVTRSASNSFSLQKPMSPTVSRAFKDALNADHREKTDLMFAARKKLREESDYAILPHASRALRHTDVEEDAQKPHMMAQIKACLEYWLPRRLNSLLRHHLTSAGARLKWRSKKFYEVDYESTGD